MNLANETIKVLEENFGEYLCNLGVEKAVLKNGLKVEKVDTLDFTKMKKSVC